MNIKFKKQTITEYFSSIIILFFFMMRTLIVIQGNQIYSIIAFSLGMLALLNVILNLKRFKIRPFIILSVIYFFMVISNIISRNMELGLIFNLQYMGIALSLIYFKINYKLTRISYIIHAIYILYFIVLGFNPAEIFYFSRNQISSVMIVQSILLYISILQHDKNVSIIPAVITTLISAWALGRSGMISSVFLLSVILVYKRRTKLLNKNSFIKLIIIVGVIVISPQIIDNLISNIGNNFLMLISRFEREGFGERQLIILEYFKIALSNIKNFIFGPKIYSSQYLMLFEGNLHNSYLGIHAYYGLGGLICIIYVIFSGVRNLIKTKSWIFLGLLGVIFIRIFTDSLAFPGYFDPLIYYFLFSKYHHRYTFNGIKLGE